MGGTDLSLINQVCGAILIHSPNDIFLKRDKRLRAEGRINHDNLWIVVFEIPRIVKKKKKMLIVVRFRNETFRSY